jgi:uncharacterized protein (DUF433 family)
MFFEGAVMPGAGRRRVEETYTTAEAAVILTLAGSRDGRPVSKRAIDGAIDQGLFPSMVIRRRGGVRALTATGVKLAAAEFVLRRELPVREARRRVYRLLTEKGARQGPVRAGRAVTVDVGGPLTRAGEAIERYERLMREIERNPSVQRGEPVIRETRVTAHTIAELAARGTSVEEILRHYPSLNADQIEAARLYALAHPRRGRPPLPNRGRVLLTMTAEELQAV